MQGKEVLIIDDARDSRLILRNILSNLGMNCTEADSVDSALASLRTKFPHLILLDLSMGARSGFDFLSERLKDPQLCGVPVIVVSASADRESVYRAAAFGATDYLIKPASASLLIRKARRALKDSDFKSYTVPNGKNEKLTVHFPAQLTRPAETEFYLESNVKIAGESQIRLESPLLDEVGMASCVYVATGLPNVRGPEGNYFTKVKVMGLTAAMPRLLQKKAGSAK